jgi:hypothetical protein
MIQRYQSPKIMLLYLSEVSMRNISKERFVATNVRFKAPDASGHRL